MNQVHRVLQAGEFPKIMQLEIDRRPLFFSLLLLNVAAPHQKERLSY